MGNKWAVQRVIETAEELRRSADGLSARADDLMSVAERLRGNGDVMPPFEDIIADIPVNPSPTSPVAWWVRQLSEIRGITIHHTLSHSPIATARYVIEKKGRPTLPYHFWVDKDGAAFLCVPLHFGMWHDHTGHRNVNISIGMAGHLHKVRPPLAQLETTVNLVLWLMEEYQIPVDQVRGHKDRYAATICPGWDAKMWREQFYENLRAELEPF